VEQIRVRFPPSPTGYLHIGGARTALFNWLFCRKNRGTLVLRIEDTDTERSTAESAREILDGLAWMGLDWDEGPYFQSEYAAEHRAVAERLVEQGAAYRCYCSREELEAKREAAKQAKQDLGYDGTCRDLTAAQRRAYEAEGRPAVVRFRVPDDPGEAAFDDLVFGRMEQPRIEDFIIVRSNGEPLYVLSNAVDDHRDRISHVLRGQEHLMNTPKQVLIYKALGWPVPKFAHMALILDPKKTKISKRRHGDVVTVQFYKEKGFLPWAFCNFTALLGWSAGGDRELFYSREELLEAFSLEGLVRRNAVFNYRKDDPKFITDPKALHINAEHMRALPPEDLAPYVQAQLEAVGLWRSEWAANGAQRAWFLRTIDLIRARFHVLTDFVTEGRAYFADDFPIDETARKKSLQKDPALKQYLPKLADRLAAVDHFDLETSEAALREVADELGIKAGLLINAARAAVTGQPKGPGLFDVLCAVGRDRTVARLRRAADLVDAG
jgi:glutamyl-tRNA synthetase